MKNCSHSATLSAVLETPIELLALTGFDGDEDDKGEKPGSTDSDEKDDKGAKPGSVDNGEDEDEDDKGKGGKPDAKDRRIHNLTEEKDRHLSKRNEAEAEVKSLKDELAKLKKDGTPDDALKKDNANLTADNESLRAANNQLMLQNAFLTETGFDWVDPESAMKLANLSEVEFDEKSNKAIGLGSALAKLAKDKPFLLKKKAEENDDDEGSRRKPAPSGRAPRGGSNNKSDAATRKAKLQSKYPGLRR